MPEPIEPCPVEVAIHIIGGKWKLLVLRSLLLNGPQRYNELLGTVTAISQKELTRNLRELGDARLVSRDGGEGRLSRYELTEPGQALMPTFESLLVWGQNLLAREHELPHLSVR
jgi:DNA-binding HxlR family transcriptional regulator